MLAINLLIIKTFNNISFPGTLKLLWENKNNNFMQRKLQEDITWVKRLGVNANEKLELL